MSQLDEILLHNQKFVADRTYKNFTTDKYPDRHLAVLGCMDTRLTELLPQAMGLKNGDVKLIKNAGATITHPWGSAMRSLLIGVYQLQVNEIIVVGHHDCGMLGMNAQQFLSAARNHGVPQERIDFLHHAGVNWDSWLRGFDCVEESVRSTVNVIRNHPLMPQTVPVHGLVIHPETGKLEVVVRDEKA